MFVAIAGMSMSQPLVIPHGVAHNNIVLHRETIAFVCYSAFGRR